MELSTEENSLSLKLLDSYEEKLPSINVETKFDEGNQSVESSCNKIICAQTNALNIGSTNSCINQLTKKRIINQQKNGYPKLSRCSTFWECHKF